MSLDYVFENSPTIVTKKGMKIGRKIGHVCAYANCDESRALRWMTNIGAPK